MYFVLLAICNVPKSIVQRMWIKKQLKVGTELQLFAQKKWLLRLCIKFLLSAVFPFLLAFNFCAAL